MNLARVIEALLFSAQKPLSAKEISETLRNAGAEGDFAPNEFANVKPAEVAAAIEQLKIEYIQNEHGFQLVEKAEGWQLASDPKYAQWVRGLFPAPKPSRQLGCCGAQFSSRLALALLAPRWVVMHATATEPPAHAIRRR